MVQELQDPDNDNFNPDSSSNKRSYDGATKVSKKRKAVGNFLSEDEKKVW